MKNSVRSQLLLALIVAMSAIYLLRLATSFLETEQLTNEAYDEMLRNSADSVAFWLDGSEGRYKLEVPSESLPILTHNARDSFYYEIFDSSGTRLIGNAHLVPSGLSIGSAVARGAEDIVVSDQPLRFVALEVRVPEKKLKSVIVALAETKHARHDFFMRSFLSDAVSDLIVIIICLSLVSLFINRVFVPFDQLKETIARRKRAELDRLSDFAVPDEIRPLILEFNKMSNDLQATVEARERFVSNAAHQLRTPVAALKTYSSFGCCLEDASEQKDVLQRIDKGLDSMTRLINQLLALVRLEGNAVFVPELKTVDLKEVGQNVTTLMKVQAADKEIDLIFESSPDDVVVLGDAVALEQLVTNLVENAIAYSPARSEVKIIASKNGSPILLVEDHGPGIPSAERSNVFERFYRVQGNGGKGSGLGLSIVQEIAVVHRADVAIETASSGVGTCVKVSFPMPEDRALPKR